jgi:hypothetical protein
MVGGSFKGEAAGLCFLVRGMDETLTITPQNKMMSCCRRGASGEGRQL